MRDYNTTSFFLQLMNEKPKITDNNAEVIKMNVYIKVEESVCIDHKEIKLKEKSLGTFLRDFINVRRLISTITIILFFIILIF